MQELIGILQIKRDNIQSKSEGLYAHLITPSGEDYILYRAERIAQDDPFFQDWDQQQVRVTGEREPRTNFVCIETIEPFNP